MPTAWRSRRCARPSWGRRTSSRRPGSGESVFATRTMAELLERQGDRAGAARIRSRLERSRAPSAGGPSNDRRGRVVRELERWLANLRTEA